MKTLATDRRKRYLGRRIMTDDAGCCCGGGCSGATSCCGPSTCGLLAPLDPIRLSRFSVSGSCTLNTSYRDPDFPGDNYDLAFAMDFAPIRYPSSFWAQNGTPPTGCVRSYSTPGSGPSWTDGTRTWQHNILWNAQLDLQSPPGHLQLQYIQEESYQKIIFGFPQTVRGSVTVRFQPTLSTPISHVDVAANLMPTQRVPFTGDILSAGTCNLGGDVLAVASGSGQVDQGGRAFSLWSFNCAIRVIAEWNLCGCTGGSSPGCTDCGQDGGL